MRYDIHEGVVDTALKERLLRQAIDLYRTRVLDNVDLSRLADLDSRAKVVARALMEKGDARAFALGRELLAACGS